MNAAPAPVRPDPDHYAALRSGCALFAADGRPAARRALLEMTGEDRARFLQGLVTCDVGSLAPGGGAWGFFTTVKGRVLADVAVLAGANDWWLSVPEVEAEAIREHALKYRIADRVEIEPLPDRALLTLAGPQAAAVLEAEGAGREGAELPGAAWSSLGTEVGGMPARVVGEGLLGVAGYTLWVDESGAEGLRRGLLDRHPGLVVAGEAASEAVRVEAGIARFGQDYDGGHFPQESGLGDRAVSYSKGCYLGQEVVARIHYRGGVQRAPAGLLIPSELIAAGLGPGVPLLHDGRPAGDLTSLVYSLALERWIGLSILHNRASESGTELAVEGFESQTPIEVAELPFVR